MKYILGTGKLTWERHERISDRYGYVYLLAHGDSRSKDDEVAPIQKTGDEGKRAVLRVRVVETRESTHIGDLFRGVFPSTPNIGDEILLGEGRLSFDTTLTGHTTVGLMPDDGRDSDWLDIKALYRCHEQTVELRYETT